MYDLSKNIAEAEEMLVSKPLYATSAERFLILDEIKSEWKELSQPKRFVKVLSTLLSRVSVPIMEYDLIAGRCVDRELNEEEEARFQAFISHPDEPRKHALFSSGHCAYDWGDVVSLGLPGLRERAKESMARQEDEAKREFLECTIGLYDAIAAYLRRYARAAEEKGMDALAERCRKAASERPDRFDVALQLLWIIALIDCAYITENPTLTIGRMDQILLPLYRADIASGRLTKEDAEALITDYYCKHNLIMGRGEHQVGDSENSTTFKRILNFDAPQYLLLGGTDEQDRPAVNELSMLFASCIQPRFKNPVIVVRYFVGMNETHPAFWRTLTEKATKSASMMFYNDTNIKKGLRRMGLPEEDIHDYIHFGCNWPSIGTKAAWMQGGPSSVKYKAFHSEEERIAFQNAPYMRTAGKYGWPEVFVNLMREFSTRDPETVSIDNFYDAFRERMSAFIDRKLARAKNEMEIRQRKPAAVMTFGDAFFRDSVKNAECFSAGAKYHFELQSFQMFGTVVDCFITVDRLVFLDKILTMEELLRAVDANFEGYGEILALCRKVEKYGSDTPFSNAHVRRLSRLASDLIFEKNQPYLRDYGLLLLPCMQSDTWHLKYGEKYTATPNGRLAYTPYSQNSRPSNGACINGLSAMLNSMLNLPAGGFLSGALNLDIDPRQFSGESGREMLASMLAVYFNKGGLHAQISAANVEDLIDAKAHPDRHRDLRVRVTGYSGIFVDICSRLQDDIIERFR